MLMLVNYIKLYIYLMSIKKDNSIFANIYLNRCIIVFNITKLLLPLLIPLDCLESVFQPRSLNHF